MSELTGREVAFRVLGGYRRDRTRPETALYALCEKYGVSERETALAARIINGVLQNMAFCDYVASFYSTIELKKLEPRLLDVLRISIYQIVFLTKIPHSAAVNEGVALAKKHSNPRAAGLVNAVLRRLSTDAATGSLPEITYEDAYQRLSVKYSHPEWLVRQFCSLLGMDGGEALLKTNNSSDTPITAQVNTLRADVATVVSSLASDGVEVSCHEWLDDCIYLYAPGKVERLSAFKKGLFFIQDAASRLAIIAAEPKPGEFVIDACAAPGGKSFASAIMMKNTGRIAAFDIAAAKLSQIRDGAARLGISIADTAEKDAARHDNEFAGKADIVLADVPCSGFGVIRNKPDVRYKSQSDIAGLPDIQKAILTNISSYVKPGGTLLYSTCTVLKQENEYVVEEFLSMNPEFSPSGFNLPGIGQVPDGMITLWPHIHGTDGFFICKLKKRRL